MNKREIMKIFEDTAYIRTGGSAEELKCAQYIQSCCEKIGLNASIEEFEVELADVKEAHLYAEQAKVVGNVAAHTAGRHANKARCAVPRHELYFRASPDIHVNAADNNGGVNIIFNQSSMCHISLAY